MMLRARADRKRVIMSAWSLRFVTTWLRSGDVAAGQGEIENRLHLHARSIDIPHPDGGRLAVSASLPPHMQHAWKLFGFDQKSETDPFERMR